MSISHSSGATIQKNNISDYPLKARQALVSQQQKKQVRHNSALPDDSWGYNDQTVSQTFQQELRVVNDLIGAGLVQPVPVDAETTEWDVMEGAGTATIAMSPETEDDESSITYGKTGVPVPVVMDSFSTGFRETPVQGQNPGPAVDQLGVSNASRNVAEASESLVLDGWEPSIVSGQDTYSLYGLKNHPQMDTTTLTDWTVDNTVVRSEIRAMIRLLRDDNLVKPGGMGYWLYLGSELWDVLDDADPEGNGNQNIRQRVENLSALSRVESADYLDPKEAIMFRPTNDVIDLAIATTPGGEQVFGTTVEWSDLPGFRDHFQVMNIFAPRVKATKTNQVGVTYASV